MIPWLRTFPTEIEYDINHLWPGHDIAEWWRGEMSSRRLALFLDHLPETSATMMAAHETEWPQANYLLAYIGDQLAYGRAEFVQANGGQLTPQALPRPGDQSVEERREEQRTVHDMLVDMMGGNTS